MGWVRLLVFAEIDETLCLSAEGITKALTPKTKSYLFGSHVWRNGRHGCYHESSK